MCMRETVCVCESVRVRERQYVSEREREREKDCVCGGDERERQREENMVPCCDQTPGRKSRVNIPTVSSHIGDGASISAFLGCRQSAS